MKIWLVATTDTTNPQGKVYLMGAHSALEGAHKQQQELAGAGNRASHIIDMDVDGRQPPVLIKPSDTGDAGCVRDTQKD